MSSDTGSEYAPTVSDGESTDSDDFLADEQLTSARAAERLVVEDWEVAELVDDSCKAEEEDADVVDLVADSGDDEGRVSRAGARSRKPRKPRQPRKPKPSRSDWHDLEPLPVDERLMDEAEGAEELGDEMLPCKALRQLDPSPDVITELLPYQKEFLFWAVGQEEGLIKGGILADEMGMGKTIQAISLIATHRQDGKLSRHAAPGTLPDAPDGAATPRPALRLRGVRPAALGDAEQKESVDAASPRASREASPAAIEGALLEVSPGTSAGESKPLNAGEADEAAALAAARAAARLRGEHIRAERVCAESLGLHTSGATLVVCPLVAVIQWKAEIERHVAPGALRVATFHGQKRTADAEALASADVVLTTYSTLESEHRRMTQASDRLVCDYCGKRFTPARLHVHLRFFCGPHAKKSEALARQERKRPRRGDKMVEREEEDAEEDGEEDAEEDAEEEEDLKKGAKLTGRRKATGAAAKKAGAKGGKKEGASSVAAEAKKASATKKVSAKKASQAPNKKPAGRMTRATSVEPSPADDPPDLSDASSDGDSLSDSDAQLMAEFMTEDGAFKDAASQAAFEMMVRQTTGAAAEASAPRSVLHEIFWRRIVLDEAHCIKDRRCSTARATFALQARYRWALSGTPLQNRVGELYSLVRFLRISPYSYYYCRHCDCKHLDYPFRDRTRRCVSCPHGPLHHFCWWNKYVANPIKAHGYEGPGREAMLVLKNEVLSRILLRRTKVQQADVLALPPRIVMVRRDRMDAAEEDFYEALYTQSRAQFDAYVGAGTLVNNYSHIFSLLVRLRQAVNHPYLVVHTQSDAAEALHGAGAASAVAAAVVDEAVGAVGDDDGDAGSCPLCHDPMEPAATARTRCGHSYCRACLEEYVSAGGQACPVCSQPLGEEFRAENAGGDQNAVGSIEDRLSDPSTADAYTLPAVRRYGRRKNSILSRIDPNRFESSTKIEALREEIHRMLARDPSAKAIVFSQFTSFLDLCAFRLQQTGIQCVQLMGSQSMAQRNAQIDAFAHDPDVRVFLMSLKAGGIALNLTAASHCFLMDPWWNPAAEWQALDRIHRLGQFKPMRAVRFIIAGSIEERIVKLQGKKQLIFEGTVGQDAGALARLTEDDLKFLFG